MSYLSYLLQQLIEKREQLIRLKNTKTTILNLQDILVKQELSVDEPALTASLWNGNTARSFVDKREVVKSSYIDITYSQVGNAIKVIDDKISSIQVDIQTLEIKIEMEKARIENERRVENR
ncbi:MULTISPECIES: YwqH-like family protein [Bacillaceae]|uniref:YwqH-like family protein n=1 Tax=Bacillaceae TaxID=186817 RepID=UPI00159BCBCB|nr:MULTISPECIES: DUF5082 family protein [Bacillaceae]UGB31228.1 DUF5082 domain-containing protein [Metabacillus sp. B2-18]